MKKPRFLIKFFMEENFEKSKSLVNFARKKLRFLPHLQKSLYSRFHLLSFASGEFKKRQEALDEYVKNKIFCQHIKTDEKSAEHANLFGDNPNFSPKQRGYGFWLWKPFFIYKLLKTIPSNDVLCYFDSGDRFRRDPVPLLSELHKEYDIILNSKEKFITMEWTKRDTLIKMNKDFSFYHNCFQIEAGFLSIKKTDWSEKFIAEWLAKCRDFQLISDNPSEHGSEYQKFQDHRHDQAILNLLSFHPKICRSKQIDRYIIQNA